MRALVLNGAVALRDLADAVETELCRALEARGYAVLRRDLTALDVPDCRGDFGCWTATPGVCIHPGPHRDLAREAIASDLVAWLTPVTFGGCSSCLKRHLDHWIPLVSPRFTMVRGETHHASRYPRFPDLLAIGLLDRPDPPAVALFQRLVRRNALNMHAPRAASACLAREELPRLRSLAQALLDDLASAEAGPSAGPIDLSPAADLPAVRPSRALLVTGSPRGAASVSAALAGQLALELERRSVQVSTVSLHRARREDPDLRRLAALRDADLVALLAPLYVDGLPGPVTAALERLQARAASPGAARPRFLAVVNCGFPEAVHAHTALAMARLFAASAGLDWIGGLAVGGGAMLHGRPLAEQGARARHVVRALALTAEAVARGGTVPDEASRLAATLPIPAWLYRIMADRGFRQEARRRGALEHLGDRPYPS